MQQAPIIKLSDPLPLKCGLAIKNRIAKSAMAEFMCDEFKSNPVAGHARLYKKWAEGGVGLIITGHVLIDKKHRASMKDPVIDQNADLAMFSKYAEAAKLNNTLAIVQLNHAGRQTPNAVNGCPLAPSSVRVEFEGKLKGIGRMIFKQPKAMSVQQIQEAINRFAFAAKFCQKAGFNGVQIHAAHGYLVSEFLSPKCNTRTDEWGGSLENRSRFLREIIKKIKEEVDMSKKFILGIKINSADFQQGGFTEEESSALIKMIDENKDLDFVELSGGNYESPVMSGSVGVKQSTIEREGYFQEFSVKLRKELKHTPLMVTGGFRTKDGMVNALNQGIDIIGVARPFCVEPDFPNRFFAETANAVVKAPPPSMQNTAVCMYMLSLIADNKPVDPNFKFSNFQLLHNTIKYQVYYYPPLLRKLLLSAILFLVFLFLYRVLFKQ